MVAVLWLLMPINFVCSTQASQNHRKMLSAVQNYRGSASHANIFPALRSFMQVHPEANPILFKFFCKTCFHYDWELSSKLADNLFFNLKLPWIIPHTIPKDIAELVPQTSVESCIKAAPLEKQYYVRMVLFEWNQLMQAMEDASPELLKHINTTVDPKICETLLSRLRTAVNVHKYLAKDSQFNFKDAWILYKMLEYIRHLMVLQWSTANKHGAVDTLERLWMAFISNFHKHLLHSRQSLSVKDTSLNKARAKNDQ